MAINKVEFGGRTLIDLTDTTATADKILTGYGAYGKDGVWIDGTAIESSPDGAVYQDSEGYVVLDDGPGTHVEVESLNVTENGTYTAPTGYAYSPVSVEVEPNVESLSVTPTEEQQVFDGAKYTEYYTQTFSNYIGGGTSNINYNESMVVGNKYKVHVRLYYLDKAYYPTATIDEKDAEITLSESEAASVILYDKTTQRVIYFYPTFARIPSFGSTSYEEIHFEVIFYNQSESLDGYLPVTVNAISSTYVGSGITKRSSTDLTVSGPTVTVPAGYYSAAVSKSVASAIQATPTMAFASATGLVTATATQTSGYVSAGTKSSTYQLPVKAAATYTPTETAQTIGSYQWLTGNQTVAAISSTYVGTGVTQRSAADMTVSGQYITAPAGYYSQAFSKAVDMGAIGIQLSSTFTSEINVGINSDYGKIYAIGGRGVSFYANASISSGYINSQTSVPFSFYYEFNSSVYLPTLSATTYTPTETAQTIGSYQWLTGVQTIAAISSTYVGTGIAQRSAADIYQSGTYVSAASGYYSLPTILNLPTTDHLNPTLNFNSATGSIRASHDAYDAIMGGKMMTGGAYTSSSMTLPVLAATTYTPTTTAQTISSYQWLTGTQTIAGDANLVSSNIKSGVSIFGVVGTVPDENDLPTIYRTWDDSIGEDGGYVYSCNYTHNQIVSMVTALNSAPLAGEFHDTWNDGGTIISYRNGGTWVTDYDENDPVLYVFSYSPVKYRYYSSGSFEEIPVLQIKNVTPSRYARYVHADYPYDFLSQVTVAGDNNLISSNIRSGVSIFGVQGTLSADRTFENNIVQRKYISSYVNNDISMIGAFAFTEQTVAYMECLSVKSIYSYAFRYAGYGTFSNGMSFPSCSYLGEGIFYGARISKVSFPSCINIGESCFYSCSSLAEVSFPNCRTISQSAFYLASKLISADFPHVTSIEQYAFYGCFKLISISFPECSRVGNNAFQECRSLENVYLPILNNSVYSSCTYLFARCSNLSSINLPAMTTIGQNMFYSCPKLENVSIPLCKSIFDSAFYNCTSLSSISFPLCTSIYSGAFLSCTNLIDVNLPALTTIQYSVFENCTALESINLPLVQILMPDTFFSCKNLKNVSLPACSVFGARAFYGCSSLTFNNIYAPSVTKIGGSAFANCIEFSEVFYSNITFEGAYAFTGCQNLTSVTFINCPGIWNFTFVSCYNLLSLYLLGSSVTALSNRNAFNSTPIYNYTASTGGVYGSIYVPASLYDSYRTATNWTTFSSRFVSLTDAEIEALNT